MQPATRGRSEDHRAGAAPALSAPDGAAVQPTRFVKRVIGLPGDHIRAEKGHLWINGQPVQEPYVWGETYDFPSAGYESGGLQVEGGEVVVPEGKLFVMGDNRPNSGDARFFGPVPVSSVKGRAIAIYWPLDRMHGL